MPSLSSSLYRTTTPAITDPAYYTAAMSYAEWKHEPTTMQVLFRLHLPYRPPRSLLGRFLWRQRLWVEVTFALSMLEPWEKFLVCECSLCLPVFATSPLRPVPLLYHAIFAPIRPSFLRCMLSWLVYDKRMLTISCTPPPSPTPIPRGAFHTVLVFYLALGLLL